MTGLVLCIDPGPDQSGYVLVQDGKVIEGGRKDNDELLVQIDLLNHYVMFGTIFTPGNVTERETEAERKYTVIIEWLSCYGSAIGQSVLRTAEACGRFREMVESVYGTTYLELTRPEVCRRLAGQTRGITKAVIRRAVIDIMGEIGTKREPGPLYIMRSAGPHAWDALALYAAHEKGTEAGE